MAKLTWVPHTSLSSSTAKQVVAAWGESREVAGERWQDGGLRWQVAGGKEGEVRKVKFTEYFWNRQSGSKSKRYHIAF